ncbi:hypothetical protein OG735_17605 [Streptomyces sp. NBC_01210]|uniref:hypothetical protein n=1 Tax=Streptomyces sp. NBC_01210 TaxID=2903774 RepID=UPI002E0D927E|nr:hypothetical protein OG735_17605 [Streptomyces sp. NBC_01210]
MTTPNDAVAQWDEQTQRTYYSVGDRIVGWQQQGSYYSYDADDAGNHWIGLYNADQSTTTWWHESDPVNPCYVTDAQGQQVWSAYTAGAEQQYGTAPDDLGNSDGQGPQAAPAPDVPLQDAPQRPHLSKLRMEAMNDVFAPGRGVFVKPILLVNGQHVPVADGAVFSAGDPGGGYGDGDSYGAVQVPGLGQEMTVSARDAEVGALDAVHNYLDQNYPPNSAARGAISDLKVEFVSNIGPCNGCKCRFQEFAENMKREFPQARIETDAVYHKGNGTRFMNNYNRGPVTQYGYAGEVQAFTSHAARESDYPFVYYKKAIEPRAPVDQMRNVGNSQHLMDAAGINLNVTGDIPTTPTNPASDSSSVGSNSPRFPNGSPGSGFPDQEAAPSVAAAASLRLGNSGPVPQQPQHQSSQNQSSRPVEAPPRARGGGAPGH